MSAHFKTMCQHGTITNQCRCGHSEKRIRLLTICPSHCWALKKPTGPAYPPPGVITNGGHR